MYLSPPLGEGVVLGSRDVERGEGLREIFREVSRGERLRQLGATGLGSIGSQSRVGRQKIQLHFPRMRPRLFS